MDALADRGTVLLGGPLGDDVNSEDALLVVSAVDTDPAGAADRLATSAAALPPSRRIQVGAEDAARTDAVLGCALVFAARGLADRVGTTVQANLLRSERDVDTLTAAGVTYGWSRDARSNCGREAERAKV